MSKIEFLHNWSILQWFPWYHIHYIPLPGWNRITTANHQKQNIYKRKKPVYERKFSVEELLPAPCHIEDKLSSLLLCSLNKNKTTNTYTYGLASGFQLQGNNSRLSVAFCHLNKDYREAGRSPPWPAHFLLSF